MIYAGVLAAGVGERMNRQDLPKQFLNLGSKPIIIHTLEQFYVHSQIEKAIIVVPDDWKQYAEDLIEQYDTMSTEIVVIKGGVNKTISVKMIVDYIEENWGMSDDDVLLTHDAVRPFITQRMIEDNIQISRRYGAAITIMATNDTIAISNDGKTLSEIPPKQRMFAEQTPQTFNLRKLHGAFKAAKDKRINLNDVTELTRLYIQQGNKMWLVKGEYSNMKIINPYDLEVANALLKERES